MSSPAHLTVSAVIEAPIWRVYQNWRRLERFPSFVPSVQAARWLEPGRLLWCEEYRGKVYECIYEVTLHMHESRLSWRSLSGPEGSGTAVVEAQPGGWSRVTLKIDYVPDETLQSPEAVRQRHSGLLTAFKRHVETPRMREG